MPRPRVRPEDRRRSVRACEACRLSRKRCDSQLPCALCSDKGLGAQCHYRQSGARSASTAIPPYQQRRDADAPLSPGKTPEQGDGTMHTSYTQKGRMLLSSNGEKGRYASDREVLRASRGCIGLIALAQSTLAIPQPFPCWTFCGTPCAGRQAPPHLLRAVRGI